MSEENIENGNSGAINDEPVVPQMIRPTVVLKKSVKRMQRLKAKNEAELIDLSRRAAELDNKLTQCKHESLGAT